MEDGFGASGYLEKFEDIFRIYRRTAMEAQAAFHGTDPIGSFCGLVDARL